MGRDRQLRLCRALLVLNLCFIWGNSLLPAETSQAFSDWVKSLLLCVIPGGEEAASGSGLLRKVAHFAEFTALGLLLTWQFWLLHKNRWNALLWGTAAACMDETIQLFIPDRGPGIRDVAIDACGVLAGMGLLYLGYFLKRRYQQRKYGGKIR